MMPYWVLRSRKVIIADAHPTPTMRSPSVSSLLLGFHLRARRELITLVEIQRPVLSRCYCCASF